MARNTPSVAQAAPALVSEWSAQNTVTPDQVTIGSEKIITWESPCGHTWTSSVQSRMKGATCTYCSGRKILVGFNDLATTHPDLASEWHPEKNVLSPTEVTKGSKKKVWWRCARGHEWESTVHNRGILGRGCAVCSSKRVWTGENDLATQRPDIAAEWHPENAVTADSVTAKSDYEARWLGACGHEWVARVSQRTINDHGCPFCTGRKILVGFNDLATTHPDLVSQWDYEKNGDLTPEAVTMGSSVRAFWRCDKGHGWQTRICDRQRNRQCPTCSYGNGASSGEDAVAEYVSSIVAHEVVRHDRSVITPLELDMYVPALSLAIEFNGLYWHSDAAGKDPESHYRKWLACKQAGIQLLTVWEDDWRDRSDLVKQMLAHKTGVSRQKVVGARQCQVLELHVDETRAFLEANHIQGFAPGKYYVGLQHRSTGELVAVMVLRRERGRELQLVRFATAARVPGGQSKMLAWCDENIDYTRMVTFADHEVSDGGLYESTGWTLDGEVAPDYKYVYGGHRVHKFNFRLKRFREDSALKWQEGLTEAELAILNELPRVWDCGKTRYVRSNPHSGS